MLSLHRLSHRTKRQIAKYCPTRSLDRRTESVLIGRLLEVKGDSVKAINFYTSMEYSGRKTGLCMQNERIWADRRGNIYLVNAC